MKIRSLIICLMVGAGVMLVFGQNLISRQAMAFDASVGLAESEVKNVSDKKEDSSAANSEASAGADDKLIEHGQELYGNTCLFCHGPGAVGARAPSLITGHWAPGGANDDAYMMSVIKNGREGTIMGAFKDSHTEDEIKAIMAYIRHEAKLLADKKAK